MGVAGKGFRYLPECLTEERLISTVKNLAGAWKAFEETRHELLAICDLVVVGDDAQFGHPAGRDLGIPPTVFMWPMLIGMRKTRELLYTAKLIGATEADRLGLVNQVAPRGLLDQHTRELALDVARTPPNHLTLLKYATNRFYENMGMFGSWQNGAELDAIFHQSLAYVAFFKLVKEQGMRAALDNRRKL